MRGNPTNSATVFPHKAADAGELGHLDPHLSAQGHRCAGTRPTRPPSLRTRPQMRGNPATSTPISPHKATDAGNPATSTPISPHKATDAGEPGQLGHRLSAQGH